MKVTAETEFFSVAEVGRMLKVGPDKVIQLFEDEPDIVVLTNPQRKKRQYRTLRIPREVYERVLTRLTQRAA